MAGDRYFFPITIKAGENKLVFDDGGIKEVTVPPGVYYTHKDSYLHGLGWRCIYITLEGLINPLVAPASWSFWPFITPVGSKLVFSGLRVFRSSSGTWQVSRAGTTLDIGILGLSSPVAPVVTGQDFFSPMSVIGRWQSYTLLDHEATDKRANPSYEVYTSTEEIQTTTRQVRARERRLVRTVEYEYVPGLHVFGGHIRSDDPDYYEPAGMVQGDDRNAFEYFWESASSGADVIVSYGAPEDGVTANYYEICVMANSEQRRSLSNCVELMRAGGELYRVTFDILVKDGNFEY